MYQLLFQSRKPIARTFQLWAYQQLKGLRLQKLNEARALQSSTGHPAPAEAHYQKIFEDACGATHSRNTFGTTDITTEKAHIEIKSWPDYKAALGQLLFYNSSAPKMRLFVCFFGTRPEDERMTQIHAVFAQHHISLIYFPEGKDDQVHVHDTGSTTSLSDFVRMCL
jgi:hypothetical protein